MIKPLDGNAVKRKRRSVPPLQQGLTNVSRQMLGYKLEVGITLAYLGMSLRIQIDRKLERFQGWQNYFSSVRVYPSVRAAVRFSPVSLVNLHQVVRAWMNTKRDEHCSEIAWNFRSKRAVSGLSSAFTFDVTFQRRMERRLHTSKKIYRDSIKVMHTCMSHLFSQGTYMIWFKCTTAFNVSYSHIVSLAGIFMTIKPSQ